MLLGVNLGIHNPHAYAQQYDVVTPAACGVLQLCDVKEFLKLDGVDASTTSMLEMMMAAVEDYFQRYTGLVLITTTFKTYRKHWDNGELRKSPAQAVTLITYVDETGATQTLDPANYWLVPQPGYSRLEFKQWANSLPQHRHHGPEIQITFTAGFGADHTSVPKHIYRALLSHLVNWWENRGDCSECSDALPGVAKTVYDQLKVRSLTGGVYN